jgi:hypothetical protein
VCEQISLSWGVGWQRSRDIERVVGWCATAAAAAHEHNGVGVVVVVVVGVGARLRRFATTNFPLVWPSQMVRRMPYTWKYVTPLLGLLPTQSVYVRNNTFSTYILRSREIIRPFSISIFKLSRRNQY